MKKIDMENKTKTHKVTVHTKMIKSDFGIALAKTTKYKKNNIQVRILSSEDDVKYYINDLTKDEVILLNKSLNELIGKL